MRSWFSSIFRHGVSAVALAFVIGLFLSPSSSHAQVCGNGIIEGGGGCVGDCDGSGDVTVDEILKMVNIALGNDTLDQCEAGDGNMDGQITVDEILTAVNNALNGCPITGGAAQDEAEQCDNGGVCASGDNADASCTSDAECPGEGMCVQGVNEFRACSNDSDCPGGRCAHCQPVGGDGCSSNCTEERVLRLTLKEGAINSAGGLEDGTSGAIVETPLFPLALPVKGLIDLTIGEEREGHIPFVVKEGDQVIPEIMVSSRCLRLRPQYCCKNLRWHGLRLQ